MGIPLISTFYYAHMHISHAFAINVNKEKEELDTQPSGPLCMYVKVYTQSTANIINCGHLHARI